MKKIILATLALSLLAFTIPAHAQDSPRGDVAVGYSLFHLNGCCDTGVTTNGISGSFDYNANRWVGIVWDMGVYHGEQRGAGVTAATYAFGPRLWLHLSGTEKFLPFAQMLFGGSHIPGSNPFAFGVGGGVDIRIGDGPFAFRPQFDYFGLHPSGGTINSERFSLGIVYNFGSR